MVVIHPPARAAPACRSTLALAGLHRQAVSADRVDKSLIWHNPRAWPDYRSDQRALHHGALPDHRLATGGGQVGRQVVGGRAAVDVDQVVDDQVDPALLVQGPPGDLVEPGRCRREVPDGPPGQQRGPDVPKVAEVGARLLCRVDPARADFGDLRYVGSTRQSRRGRSPSQPASSRASGSGSAGDHESALVSSTAAPATQSRSRPRAPAVPSATGTTTETRTSRPDRCASSCSRWWCTLTAVRLTLGATRSSAQSTSGRFATGQRAFGRRSVSGLSRVPAPAASTTPTGRGSDGAVVIGPAWITAIRRMARWAL